MSSSTDQPVRRETDGVPAYASRTPLPGSGPHYGDGTPAGSPSAARRADQPRDGQRDHDSNVELLLELEQAVVSRTVVGRAQGILMERHHLTAEQAFTRLRVTSQHLNRKLREVAEELVDTGQEALSEEQLRSLCDGR